MKKKSSNNRTVSAAFRAVAAAVCLLLCHVSAPAVDTAPKSFMSSYNTGYLSVADGLPHNYVDDVFRDSRGFLWIGMGGGGLTRYDGNELVNFSISSDEYHLAGSFAVELAEDRFQRLWVATEGGLSVINLYTLRPEPVEDSTGVLYDVLCRQVWAVTVDAEGKLWTRANNSIICIDFNSDGSVAAIYELPDLRHPDGPTAVRDVYGNGKVWTVIDGTVSELSLDNGMIKVRPVSDCLVFLPDIAVTDILLYGSDIWLATDRGLCRYNPAANISRMYLHNASDPASLSQNYSSTLAVSPDSRLMVGTLQGVNIYNQINDNFERIKQAYPGQTGSINNNFINKIFVDGDRIWIGTEGCGLNRLSPKRLVVKEVNHNFDLSGRRFNTPVNAILSDSDGTLWFGAVEGGLHRSDSRLEQFRHYSVENGVLGHNSVSALARDGAGNLWVGTWGGGVDVFSEPEPGQLRKQRHIIATDGADTKHIGYIGAFMWDSINNLMWIGASRGLFVHNHATGLVSEAYDGCVDDVFGAIGSTIDSEGHLWFGSSKGLIDIDLYAYRRTHSAEAVRRIRGRLDNPESVADERITYLFTDSDNRLWIATNGNGVFQRYKDEDWEGFVSIATSAGLPSDIVLGIAEDNDGNIWFSTYRGVARYSPEGNITVFSRDGDLGTDQFYWNAAATDMDGNVLFGTTEGLMSIGGVLPARESSRTIPIAFTHVRVDNNEIAPGENDGDISFCPVRGMKIHESTRSVSFEFSAFDYDADAGGVYAYRLVGFDDTWTDLPRGRRYAGFTNLKPGRYTFQVRYTHKGENENEAALTSLPITVTQSFYRTWWFIFLMALCTAGIAFLVYKLRLSSLEKQRKLLQTTVLERTAEIEEQKRQVQQLTMDRISFFTNITHEFRTPITLILGPIERALKLSYNPGVIEQLNFARRNSKYLLTLVNQLMDFRKLESGKMEIMRSRGNLLTFLKNTVDIFRPIASDRSINLSLNARLPLPMMNFDEEALQKVLINLLGNALKFTPEGGRITLYATVLPPACSASGSGALYLAVADSGTGIAPKDINRIFDRFYQGTSPMKYPVSGMAGSGIGLYLCHSLVDIYGGRITVANNHNGRGCTFRVVLPLTDDDKPSAAPAEAASAENHVVQATRGNERSPEPEVTVLIVEDNDDMRAFIRSILAERFSVAEARNGEEALKVLSHRDISLIISDLMMPVMDGMELSRQVKENFDISHIPFLMLTAKAGREPQLESYRMGVDAYILKPFDEEMLLARIDGILKSRRGYQKRFATQLEVESLNISDESRDKKFMDDVMKVIADNYRNSYFEIGHFAEALGVSRSLLNKKLQNLAGQSAGQLLRAYRLKTAYELIVRNRRTRSMNISEIAYEVGFNDSKYFTRCFTKQFSINPSALMNEQG